MRMNANCMGQQKIFLGNLHTSENVVFKGTLTKTSYQQNFTGKKLKGAISRYTVELPLFFVRSHLNSFHLPRSLMAEAHQRKPLPTQI